MADIRISATDLDGYQFFRGSDYLSLDDYIRRLRREDEPGPEAMAGIKFHTALQRQATPREGYDPPGYWVKTLGSLEGPTITHVYYLPDKIEIALPLPTLTEMWIERVFTLPNGREVEVKGRVDAVHGREITDYKTTKRIDVESYMEAWQWRIYLAMMPEMETFRYDVFQLEPLKSRGKPYKEYSVKTYEKVTMRRYGNLEADVVKAIDEYDQFLQGLAADGHIQLNAKGVVRTE